MSRTRTESASRETSPATVGPLTVNVVLPASRGVASVGPYLPGTPVQLPADEAIRLVEAKGFAYVSAADAQVAATHIEQRNATASAHAEVAAAADGAGGGTPITATQE